MKIDHNQLAAFAEALREGTFDLAARKLHVTPSAISQRIKLLEERLGQVLIQRTTPCQPTAAGRALLRYAEALAVLETEVLAELGLGDADALQPVRLPVVVNADSLDSWFPDVFTELADAFATPGITLDLRVEDQDHSATLLRDGTVIAGVSGSAEAIQGCRVEPLGVMRYLAVAAPGFRARHFAGGVSADALASAPMLRFNKKDALQQAFVERFTAEAQRPPTHFAPTTRAFCEAVRRGLAWGMVPEPMAADLLRAGQLVELAPARWIDVPLFWHRWRIASPALDRLTAAVHRAAQQALRA